MMISSFRFRTVAACAVVVVTGLTVASCAPEYSSPQQVQTTAPVNPTVSYKYRGDQQLVQANQNAAVFCNQYQAISRTKNFSTDQDGGKVVVFECLHGSPLPVLPPQYNPNLGYNYMTDQELVDASRNAQIYCMNNGSQQVTTNVSTNANGTRTATFQCGPTVVIR